MTKVEESGTRGSGTQGMRRVISRPRDPNDESSVSLKREVERGPLTKGRDHGVETQELES